MSITVPTNSRWSVERVRAGVSRRADRLIGRTSTHWVRVVMDRETERFVKSLNIPSLSACEISGMKWSQMGFRQYRSANYPDYDVCQGPIKDSLFDIVIAEQVLEHVVWPYRAVRNVFEMLKPGGVFVVTTPFLLRVHEYPVDCSRWTPLGLKHLLAEGGFPIERTIIGSWGNRACVRANLKAWRHWIPWLHSLQNDPFYPVVVWGFAFKPQ